MSEPSRRRWPTRRQVIGGLGALGASGFATAAYGTGIEPFWSVVTHYAVRPRAAWPAGLRLRFVALADIHACEPWMTVERVAGLVAAANALGPDLIVLLGDYVAGQRFITRRLRAEEWAAPLAGLAAPLGVHAVLGNHDWWEDARAQARGGGPVEAAVALAGVGIRVLENAAVPLAVPGGPVWLAGLQDQLALLPHHHRLRRETGAAPGRVGLDDLAATLAAVPPEAPVILLAHEPDIFPRVPARVALTLSGHTHGGQVRFFGYAPVVPSRYGRRYAYGHIREHTDLIVSGGLGMSIAPIRIGVPPEIVVVEIGTEAAA
ncbi:metallophosphoesterase [Methylobacterium sp. 4-46]|uniref:metallophosphoesterase n=1 Tax=unclassified Methylobacterium TaxID=2615210 RepID=UPI000152E86B|nr:MULTISPECIES: metallophosphoesterase [Methylobacterium]ACA15633.1 metallophosphoesterase [Methylobacterium sp. 4-46]WFT81346.1 metallophosphoesterase [Methylobacterium nodulans]